MVSRKSKATWVDDRVLGQLLERREGLFELIQSLGERLVEVENAITAHYTVHVPGQHIVVGKVTRTTYVIVGISYTDTAPWYVLWCRKQLTASCYSAEIYMLRRPDKYVGVDTRDSKDGVHPSIDGSNTTERVLLRYKDLKRFQRNVRFPSVYAYPPLPSQQVNAGGKCFMYAGSDSELTAYKGEGEVFPKIQSVIAGSKLYEPSIVDEWIVQRIMRKRKKRRKPTTEGMLPAIVDGKNAISENSKNIANIIQGETSLGEVTAPVIPQEIFVKRRGRRKGGKNRMKVSKGFVRPSSLDKRDSDNSELL